MILQFYSDEFQSDAAFIFNFVSSTNAAKVYHKFEMRNKRSKCWIWWNSRVLVEMKRHGWAKNIKSCVYLVFAMICHDQNLDDHYCVVRNQKQNLWWSESGWSLLCCEESESESESVMSRIWMIITVLQNLNLNLWWSESGWSLLRIGSGVLWGMGDLRESGGSVRPPGTQHCIQPPKPDLIKFNKKNIPSLFVTE